MIHSISKNDIKSKSILKADFEKRGGLWTANVTDLRFHVAEKTLSRLQASIKQALEEMVGERGFSVAVVRGSVKADYFLIIPSNPKILATIVKARKRKFKSRSKDIKKGPTNSLTASLDFDLNPLKPYPVLLFMPSESMDEHYHIQLSWAEVKRLKSWLGQFDLERPNPYLESKKKR